MDVDPSHELGQASGKSTVREVRFGGLATDHHEVEGSNINAELSPSAPFRVIDERTDGGAAVFTVVVPEDCPFFEGHFPGRPILPAIGQLAMLTGLVQRVTGSAVSLTGVDDFRLHRQVLPGDRVEVRLEAPRAGSTARFEIRRDGAPVSRGTVRFAVEADG
ncbi:MAG: beta-hydroxyacyl-ACP dehydratase [Acidobacteria bacterium]|nr:beta-hydroxyacyl-ACP dehydratase [Acidobacteriota bacterium]